MTDEKSLYHCVLKLKGIYSIIQLDIDKLDEDNLCELLKTPPNKMDIILVARDKKRDILIASGGENQLFMGDDKQGSYHLEISDVYNPSS